MQTIIELCDYNMQVFIYWDNLLIISSNYVILQGSQSQCVCYPSIIRVVATKGKHEDTRLMHWTPRLLYNSRLPLLQFGNVLNPITPRTKRGIDSIYLSQEWKKKTPDLQTPQNEPTNIHLDLHWWGVSNNRAKPL